MLIFCFWIDLSTSVCNMTLHKSWVFLYNWWTAQPKARAAWVLVFLWKCSILFSLFFLSNGSDLKSLDFSASPEGPEYTGRNVSHAKRKMTRVGRERQRKCWRGFSSKGEGLSTLLLIPLGINKSLWTTGTHLSPTQVHCQQTTPHQKPISHGEHPSSPGFIREGVTV